MFGATCLFKVLAIGSGRSRVQVLSLNVEISKLLQHGVSRLLFSPGVLGGRFGYFLFFFCFGGGEREEESEAKRRGGCFSLE